MSEAPESNVLFPWEAGNEPPEAEGGRKGSEGEGGRGAEAEPEAQPGEHADVSAEADAAPAASAAFTEGEDDEERFSVLNSEIGRRASERAAALLRERPVAPKEYYAISEVCDIVGLKPHVLRYWETQFQVLNPSKNRSGNRVYQRKEIKLILLVKHLLYDEKYTVEGAKARLDQMRRGGEMGTVGGVVDREMLELLRSDLSELAALLEPPKTA